MKIFIADQSEVLRLGLTGLLENLYPGVTISGADNAQALQSQPDWKQTDLVILQQSVDKKQSEANLIAWLSLLDSGLKILVLSDQLDFSQARHLFTLGVKGYADRASPIDMISEAVARVLAGKLYLETSLLIQFLDHQTAAKIASKVYKGSLLTSKEMEIATYLIQGFKTNEISKLLSKKATTISTQKANIYQKLGISNVIELAHCMATSSKKSFSRF